MMNMDIHVHVHVLHFIINVLLSAATISNYM